MRIRSMTKNTGHLFSLALGGAVLLASAILMGAEAPAPKIEPPSAKWAASKDAPLFFGGLLIDAAGSNYRDTNRLTRLLDEVKRTPFDTIILQVRAFGDAYYSSNLVPRAYGVSEMVDQTQRFDPLGMVLAQMKADPRPRKVYALINPLRVVNVNRGIPDPETHVAKQHPDWLTRNGNFRTEDEEGNQYLEPGLEDVQIHLEQVVAELAHNYEIAGIVIDGLRYPGLAGEWGYHPKLIAEWRQKTGSPDQPKPDDSVWQEMRRENLDRLLKRMARAAKQERSNLNIAVAALAEGEPPATIEEYKMTPVYTGALQDWPRWMREKTADLILLQNYVEETEESSPRFDGWNNFAANLVVETQIEVMPVVAGHENISLDVLSQMRRSQERGFSGVVLSNYREPLLDASSRELFFRALANTVFAPDSHRMELARREPAPRPAGEQFVPPQQPPSEAAPKEVAGVDQPTKPDETVSGPEGALPPAEAAPETEPMPETARPTLDEVMQTAPPDVGKFSNLISPSEDAVIFLRRTYANIFAPEE